MNKCKHKWEVAHAMGNPQIGAIGVFICQKCMSVKEHKLKEVHDEM